MLLSDGKITKAGLDQLRGRIGVDLRIKQYNEVATADAVRKFARGIGDTNPLFLGPEQGFHNQLYGCMIAPPTFLYTVIWPTGALAGGLPGVHSFFGGNDWEWFKTIRVGDTITAKAKLTDVMEKDHSEAAGFSIIQYVEVMYTNQYLDTVAKVKGWSIRAERGGLRLKGKYKNHEPSSYSDMQMQTVVEAYDKEERRGSTVRYWEDVQENDKLIPVVKGPLSLGDIEGFASATLPPMAYGILHQYWKKHPAYFFRHPQSNRIEPVSRVNTDDYVAADIGIPAAFDYGCDRICWIGHLITNWMGDDGFLKKLRVEIRRCNLSGDATFCKGKINRKYKDGENHLVDIDVWAEDQHGNVNALGKATVKLLSREVPGGHSYLHPS